MSEKGIDPKAIQEIMSQAKSFQPIVVRINEDQYYALAPQDYDALMEEDFALNRMFVRVKQVFPVYGFLCRDKKGKGTKIKFSDKRIVKSRQMLRERAFYLDNRLFTIQSANIDKIELIDAQNFIGEDKISAEDMLSDVLTDTYTEMFSTEE